MSNERFQCIIVLALGNGKHCHENFPLLMRTLVEQPGNLNSISNWRMKKILRLQLNSQLVIVRIVPMVPHCATGAVLSRYWSRAAFQLVTGIESSANCYQWKNSPDFEFEIPVMKFKLHNLKQFRGRSGSIYDVERLPSFQLELPNILFFTRVS